MVMNGKQPQGDCKQAFIKLLTLMSVSGGLVLGTTPFAYSIPAGTGY